MSDPNAYPAMRLTHDGTLGFGDATPPVGPIAQIDFVGGKAHVWRVLLDGLPVRPTPPNPMLVPVGDSGAMALQWSVPDGDEPFTSAPLREFRTRVFEPVGEESA